VKPPRIFAEQLNAREIAANRIAAEALFSQAMGQRKFEDDVRSRAHEARWRPRDLEATLPALDVPVR